MSRRKLQSPIAPRRAWRCQKRSWRIVRRSRSSPLSITPRRKGTIKRWKRFRRIPLLVTRQGSEKDAPGHHRSPIMALSPRTHWFGKSIIGELDFMHQAKQRKPRNLTIEETDGCTLSMVGRKKLSRRSSIFRSWAKRLDKCEADCIWKPADKMLS